MKKIFFIFVLIVCSCFRVNASELYINTSGVSMNTNQYNYIVNLYGSEYPEIITQDEFDFLYEYNLFDKSISSISKSYFSNSSRSTSYTNSNRTITISKSCSSKCVVTLKTVWSGIPSVQSYDVIGMRFKNTTATLFGSANVSSSTYNVSYNSSSSNFLSFTNGFGYSVKIGNGNNMTIITSAVVNLGGTVYGAYEHALINVSLNDSKNYNISSSGQGAVFGFLGSTFSKYDNVSGVSIST